jgi:hypothetical protein
MARVERSSLHVTASTDIGSQEQWLSSSDSGCQGSRGPHTEKTKELTLTYSSAAHERPTEMIAGCVCLWVFLGLI